MKIGLALGGGVARGLFHVGVLRALEKLKITIDCISGTSMGAVIGGIYALKPESSYLEETIFKIINKYSKELSLLKGSFSLTNIEAKREFVEKWSAPLKELYIWNLRIIKPSLVDLKPFLKIFKMLFGDSSFTDCKIPFCVSTVNLYNGEVLAIDQGYLYEATLASASFPGFFPPLKTPDKLLIDGGVLMPVPTKLLRSNVDFIIGINLESRDYFFPKVRSAMDVMNLADRIRYRKIIEKSLEGIDLLISADLESFDWGDFTKAKELIDRGEKEVMLVADKLMRKLKQRKFTSMFPFSRTLTNLPKSR